MTAPAGAFVFRAPVITIGGTAYANQLTKARLIPDTNMQTIRTLVPDGVVQDVDIPVWKLELSGIQDWKNTTGLCDFLNDNANLTVAAVLQPKPGTGEKTAAFNFISHPVEFGGQQGQFTTFEAEFGVIGQPVFSEAP